MPRSGGTYTPPTNSWSPAINGTLAATADWNALLTDMVAALTQSVSKDGQTVMTGSLNMGGFSLTNVASAAIATITGATLTTPIINGGTINSPVINTPTGIVKGDVGLGNVDNTSDANKPISTATQTALNGKQDLAADLTAIAGLASNGLIARTGAGTAAVRTLTAGAGVTITDGDGVAGNPTISVAGGVGLGDVLGPVSSTDNAIARFDLTTGKLLQNSVVTIDDSGNVVGAINLRTSLTADRTYYVRTDGSNSNTGLVNSAGGAFLTIQKAIDVCATLDFGGNTVTIQIGNGTYTGAVTIKAMVGMAGPSSLLILGDAGTPSNVVISTTSTGAISASGPTVQATIRGVKIQTTTSGMGVTITQGASITLDRVHFGAVANYCMLVNGGSLNISSGGAMTFAGNAQYGFYITSGGVCLAESVGTITLSGTPAFSGAFALVENTANLRINGNTFSGSATGIRYQLLGNGVIFTNAAGATYLPGGTAGTIATGGQYL